MSEQKGEKSSGQEPLKFYTAAVEAARQTATAIIAAVPEVQTVTVSIDFGDQLNGANIPCFVWQGRAGTVTGVEEIAGSLRQLTRLAGVMLERLRAVVAAYERLAEEAEGASNGQESTTTRK